MKLTAIKWHQLQPRWREFRAALVLVNDWYSLRDLIKWAKRKRLTGPLQAYRDKQVNVTIQLFHHKYRRPEMLKWTHRLYKFYRLINPPPKYYPKGYGSKYKGKTFARTSNNARPRWYRASAAV